MATQDFAVQQLLRAYRKGVISEELFASQIAELGGRRMDKMVKTARRVPLGRRQFMTEGSRTSGISLHWNMSILRCPARRWRRSSTSTVWA